jgi:DNA-binding transcriptional MerR regulator
MFKRTLSTNATLVFTIEMAFPELVANPWLVDWVDVRPSTLKYWIRLKIVLPAALPTGQRFVRFWRADEAMLVRAVKQLRDGGCPLEVIKSDLRPTLKPHLRTSAEALLRWNGSELKIVPKAAVKNQPHPTGDATHGVYLPIRRWMAEARSEAKAQLRRGGGFTLAEETLRREEILKLPRRASAMPHDDGALPPLES